MNRKVFFGKAKDGQDLHLFTIGNRSGMRVRVTELGAALVSVFVKDRDGALRDVILGYDFPEHYYENGGHFGAVVGRNGNRMDRARFTLNGQEYHLAANNNENNLHSGPDFFGKRTWNVDACSENSISFTLEDADMQQGFPGNFFCRITYSVTEDNGLKLHYEAECDADTVCNLTNHVYFNLGGHDSGDILDHTIVLPDHYTPVRDEKAIPTGEVAPTAGTPMDFTNPTRIGERIDSDFDQLVFAGGYDHNYAIRPDRGSSVKFAEAYCDKTGIRLEAFTDLPGVQFYTGNFVTDREGKGGVTYHRRSGFCLETQYYPNAVNQEGFAKPFLLQGEKYVTETVYRFSAQK